MLGLILTIENVIALIQRGLTTAKAISASVEAGRTAVIGAGNRTMTPEDVELSVERAIAQDGVTGDGAAGRLEDRPRGDGTGEP